VRPPLVSVCMPVKDAAATLREALDSILGQTLEDFEVVVVDDGSRDESPSILSEYRARDARVRVLQVEEAGVGAALRIACAEAGGRYIARMDADDVALPQRLEQQVAFLDAHSDTAVVGGAYILIGADGTRGRTVRPPSSDSAIRRALERYNPIAHSTVTMRRDAYERVGGYRLARAEDYDLWTRIAEHFRLANLREPVLLRREHTGQVSHLTLEPEVAAVLAIAAAARARREGRPDPLASVVEPSVDVLEQLGIRQERLRQAVLEAHVARAAALADVGSVGAAAQLLQRALDLAPEEDARVRAAFALRLCRSALLSGKPLAAARVALETAMRRPGATARELARAVRR
jgi:hypothetical protein